MLIETQEIKVKEMGEKIIYTTVQVRVPEKAHNLMKAAANKHDTTINQAYVDASLLFAKKMKVEVK